MPKPFPEMIQLKKSVCPSCGGPLDGDLRQVESVVHAGCSGKDCSYSVELFWLGETTVSPN